LIDALQNLHRMDQSLLEGLMTPYRNGLHLLAGAQQPHNAVPTASETGAPVRPAGRPV